MKKNQLPSKILDPWIEINRLQTRMDKTETPDPKDVDRLRELAVTTPDFGTSKCSSTQSIRHQLIEKNSHGVNRAYMLAEVDVLRKQFDYDHAPPLEQLLIDHILTVRLRLICAENAYNTYIVNKSVPLHMGEYWDGLLSSTQTRFLRAIETLARVRRLARNTPALQVNIAAAGGRQVNVQGDVNSQKATTPAEG